MNDLPALTCILDALAFEDEPTIFTEETTIDFIETTLLLIEEYTSEDPTLISSPDFHDILLEEIKTLIYVQFDNIINSYNYDMIEDDIDDILDITFQLYNSMFGIERSFNNNNNNNNNNIDLLEAKITMLKNIPQPVQRTDEWYIFRHNLITASNAYKAFETQSTKNQLIYEKCQPLKLSSSTDNDNGKEIKMVNTNTTLHWGQKYEPLSVMIYEDMYNTKVEDFGCIQHPTHKFIGASPDGINIDKLSDRYGRMLEIKNIVNREINGIPKKEYWVQMQLQMEVCDLDECDFLETKFVEYKDRESFFQNQQPEKEKGIIIYFHTKEGKPFYKYKPLNITTKEEIEKWEEEQISLYESVNGYTFMEIIYWKLEKLSCILVLRNKEWFKNNIPQLQNIWNIIEHERIHGYEHRAPVKKNKKEPANFVVVEKLPECLLKFA